MGGTPPVNPRIRWTSSSRWLIPDNFNNDFDILNGPLCLLVTFESTLTGTGFLLAKNLDATTNMQYGFAHDGSNLRIASYLENSASYSDNGSVPKGAAVWNKAIFNWDGQKIDRYNNAQFLNQTNHAVTFDKSAKYNHRCQSKCYRGYFRFSWWNSDNDFIAGFAYSKSDK